MSFRSFVAVALVIAGCSGAETPPPPAPEPAPAPEKPATPEDPGLKTEQLAANAENQSLVPSPLETQKTLEAAGITTQLATLITPHPFDIKKSESDYAAIRTGVLLADVLLTLQTSSKEDLVAHLDDVRAGLTQLNSGGDIDATLRDIQERVKADAVKREELVKEIDLLSGAVIPELEFNGNGRIVPLIQAGSWLEGANLVAKAVKAVNNPAAADKLLKQPAVVEYFLKYVQTDAADKAPQQVTAKLVESLTTLKNLASKAEPLTAADIDQVITVTDDVLKLL